VCSWKFLANADGGGQFSFECGRELLSSARQASSAERACTNVVNSVSVRSSSRSLPLMGKTAPLEPHFSIRLYDVNVLSRISAHETELA